MVLDVDVAPDQPPFKSRMIPNVTATPDQFPYKWVSKTSPEYKTAMEPRQATAQRSSSRASQAAPTLDKKPALNPGEYWKPLASKRVSVRRNFLDPSANTTALEFSPSDSQPDHAGLPGWLLRPACYQAPLFSTWDLPKPYAFASGAKNNPDIYTFDECLNSPEPIRTEWKASMCKEVRELEAHGTWVEVDQDEVEKAGHKVVPMIWTMRVKRSPSGEVTKRKGRCCYRGDVDQGDFETTSPVVSWSTIRLFLVTTLHLGWPTISCDFCNAFVQAKMERPCYMQIPRGFKSKVPGRRCLRMVKSIYGHSQAGLLWFRHLCKALKKIGLTQSAHDPCFWYGKELMIVIYTDDVGIGSRTKEIADKFIKDLRKEGLELTVESSFSEYLGIKIERNDKLGTITMTQPGLIKKVLETTKMVECKPQYTPARREALGMDPDGEPFKEEWTMPSINGMLLYLATNTRPDIAFAVSQTARFNHNPKQSHAIAVKRIIRYLKATSEKGQIIKLTDVLHFNLYVDSDFVGLFKQEPDREPTSAKSRMGYIVFLGECPLFWKSKLIPEICLSTSESEYSALSYSLREFIPVRRLMLEMVDKMGLKDVIKLPILTTIHEDNDACRLLAVNQHLSSRTKYFHVKSHFFWGWMKDNEDTVSIVRVDTKQQRADYLTKGLPREVFEFIRALVQGW